MKPGVTHFRSERGSTMLVALCFSTVLAISLGSYVAVSYGTLKQADAQVDVMVQTLAAENAIEETLHAVSTLDFETWELEGETATQTLPNIDLATIADKLPAKFTHTQEKRNASGQAQSQPQAAQQPAMPPGLAQLFAQGQGQTTTNNPLLQLLLALWQQPPAPQPAPQPAPVDESVADAGPADGSVEIKVTGLNGDGERTLTLTQQRQGEDGSIQIDTLTTVLRPLAPFQHAIVVDDSIRVRSDGVIDSYDSTKGEYSTTNSGFDATLSAKTINVSRAVVRGFAATSGNNVPSFGRRARLIGPATASTVSVDTSRIVAKPAQPRLDAAPASGTGTLFPGAGSTLSSPDATGPRTYYAGNLSLRDGESIIVDGPTVLVVDGNLSISDQARIVVRPHASLEIQVEGNATIGGQGITNESLRPDRVALIGTGSDRTEVTLRTATPWHGAIYAPKAEVTTIGDDRKLHGAIVAHSVEFEETTHFHFDTNLRKARFQGIETAYALGSGN